MYFLLNMGIFLLLMEEIQGFYTSTGGFLAGFPNRPSTATSGVAFQVAWRSKLFFVCVRRFTVQTHRAPGAIVAWMMKWWEVQREISWHVTILLHKICILTTYQLYVYIIGTYWTECPLLVGARKALASDVEVVSCFSCRLFFSNIFCIWPKETADKWDVLLDTLHTYIYISYSHILNSKSTISSW